MKKHGHTKPLGPTQALKEQLGLTDQLATTLTDAPGISISAPEIYRKTPPHTWKTYENL